MGIEETMKKDIGKHISLPDGEAIIQNAFSCYDGDFYEIIYISGKYKGDTERINIFTDEGLKL